MAESNNIHPIGKASDYLVNFYMYDPVVSAGKSFEDWAEQVNVGSFIMNLETGVMYTKLANYQGNIVLYPFTGLNDADAIDANYSPIEDDESKGIQLSDDRLKDYKDDINITLSSINKIPLKFFTYKDDDELNIGTSAQAMLKICPEVVKTNKDGYMMVDYSKLSLLALKGIRLQQAKIKSLEKKLALLDERISRLENPISEKTE